MDTSATAPSSISPINWLREVSAKHKKPLIVTGVALGALALVVIGLGLSMYFTGVGFTDIGHKILHLAHQASHKLATIGHQIADLMRKTHTLALWEILGIGAITAAGSVLACGVITLTVSKIYSSSRSLSTNNTNVTADSDVEEGLAAETAMVSSRIQNLSTGIQDIFKQDAEQDNKLNNLQQRTLTLQERVDGLFSDT